MKEPTGLLSQTYLTSSEMCKVVMQAAEPVSTREATDSMVNIIDSTYAKSELEHLASNATPVNAE